MKVLKLTNTPECLRIALAFIGSICTIKQDQKYTFLSTIRDYYLCEDIDDNVLETTWDIFLPLESLKICPFIAMRENIVFNTYGHFSQIDSISSYDLTTYKIILKAGWEMLLSKESPFISPLKLNLDWIQTIPGASIDEI
jgi:hypothetical protein